jgi:hypothetical protein
MSEGIIFEGKRGLKAPGGYFRVIANLSEFVSVGMQTSFDTLFKGIVQGTASINFPVRKRVKTGNPRDIRYTELSLTRGLTQPVCSIRDDRHALEPADRSGP